jgi:hydrogenase maturation factor
MVEKDPSTEGVIQAFVHNLTHGILVVDVDVSHAVKPEKAGDCVSIHVTFAISVEDLERKPLEVEHHLVESGIRQVSLAFREIY